MDWFMHQSMKADGSLSPVPLPLPSLSTPPPPLPPPLGDLGNKVTPSILLIIVILAIIFFVSGLLHLLVRYLLRPSHREPDAMGNATAFQGELQQLFHLHDAGVDQSFIDALPIFHYKSITGVKDPFDCAVCLCEFEADDRLRLLPKCSHAFHLQCIDTWLLSHSTCPLCRRSLLPDLSPAASCSPVLLVLDSGSESSTASGRRDSISTANLLFPGDEERRCSIDVDSSQKPVEIAAKEELDATGTKVVPVKLGKFRSADATGDHEGQGTSSGNSNLDQRRCFSMGAYDYVMDERSSLQVTIKPTKRKPDIKKSGHRIARSECDPNSRREGFKGFDAPKSSEFRVEEEDEEVDSRIPNSSSSLHKKESFSVSKIWLRPRKAEDPPAKDSSRRSVSFRLPERVGIRDEAKLKRSASPIAKSESCWDVEAGSRRNGGGVSRVDETPSFARRTLLWIVGRQNRIDSN